MYKTIMEAYSTFFYIVQRKIFIITSLTLEILEILLTYKYLPFSLKSICTLYLVLHGYLGQFKIVFSILFWLFKNSRYFFWIYWNDEMNLVKGFLIVQVDYIYRDTVWESLWPYIESLDEVSYCWLSMCKPMLMEIVKIVHDEM